MLEVFIISLILVVIIDLSGFTDSWKSGLKRLLTKGRFSSPEYSMKPFDCSFCMTFWCGMAYLLFTGQWSLLMTAWVLLVAFLTPVFKDALILGRDLVLFLLGLVNKLIIK